MDGLLALQKALEAARPMEGFLQDASVGQMEGVAGEFAQQPDSSQPPPASQRISYVPQFSSASGMILSRLSRNANTNLSIRAGPDANPIRTGQDGERSEEGLTGRGSTPELTIVMPEPKSITSGHDPVSSALAEALSSQKSLKRKRGMEDESVDFTQNTVPFDVPVPAQTASTAGLNTTGTKDHPNTKTEKPRRCPKCRGAEETSRNQLVRCKDCLTFWHQQCSAPPITYEEVQQSQWICSRCTIGADAFGGSSQALDGQDLAGAGLEALRKKRLSGLPEGVLPPKMELVGFTGGNASKEARTQYFYHKKKTDLLNLLSFCDQLKPQLLIDVLVSVTQKHPELPIFDSPTWHSSLPASASASHSKLSASLIRPKHRPSDRPRHGHTVNSPKAKQRVKITSSARTHKAAPATVQVSQEETASDEDEEEEDVLPPTWPKPGEGLYAKLEPDVDDRRLLLDANDGEAFSHFLMDNMGQQIISPAGA